MIANKQKYKLIKIGSNNYYWLDEVTCFSVALFDKVTLRVFSLVSIIFVTHLMNVEQHPLLHYSVKNTYRKLIIFLSSIAFYCNVCHNTLYEGNEVLIFIIKVWDYSHIIVILI